MGMLVILCGCHKGNLKSENLGNLVDVDLGEDNLLLDTEGIVTAAVELLVDTVEVTDTGEGYCDEPLKELIHAGTPEGNLHSDGGSAAELEVGDILSGISGHCFLSCDGSELLLSDLYELLVSGSVTDTLIEGNLHELGHLHYSCETELLLELGHDFLFVFLLEVRNVSFQAYMLILLGLF